MANIIRSVKKHALFIVVSGHACLSNSLLWNHNGQTSKQFGRMVSACRPMKTIAANRHRCSRFREVRLSPEINGPTLLNTCKYMYLFFSKIFDCVIAKSVARDCMDFSADLKQKCYCVVVDLFRQIVTLN